MNVGFPFNLDQWSAGSGSAATLGSFQLFEAAIVSYPASETIYGGRILQLAPDAISVQMLQQTVSTTPLQVVGVSALLLRGRQSYNAGDIVPILRFGQIYTAWQGSIRPIFKNAGLHCYCSSTDSSATTLRGTLTDAPLSTLSGAEVCSLPTGLVILPNVFAMGQSLTGAPNLPFGIPDNGALVSVNL